MTTHKTCQKQQNDIPEFLVHRRRIYIHIYLKAKIEKIPAAASFVGFRNKTHRPFQPDCNNNQKQYYAPLG